MEVSQRFRSSPVTGGFGANMSYYSRDLPDSPTILKKRLKTDRNPEWTFHRFLPLFHRFFALFTPLSKALLR